MKNIIAEELKRECNPTRVLDVGCSDNSLVNYFRGLGIEAVGLDIKRTSNIDILGDGESLSFKDNLFDLVTCIEVLEHLYNPENFIREARRVLVNGGFLYITTPTPLKDLIYRSFFATQDVMEHVSVKSKNEWRRALESQGFKPVSNTKNIENEIIEYFANSKSMIRKKIISLQRYFLFKITFKMVYYKSKT